MKTISLNLYTVQELKEQFPDAYKAAHRKYAETCCNQEVPWQSEIFDSLKAIISASGFTLKDWSLGSSCNRSQSLTVESSDEREELAGKRALAAFAQVLTAHGYERPTFPGWGMKFPGVCGFTGYCADDDFADDIWNELKRGETLKDAIENQASTYATMIDSEIEQAESEDEFENQAEFGDWQFTEDGERC